MEEGDEDKATMKKKENGIGRRRREARRKQ